MGFLMRENGTVPALTHGLSKGSSVRADPWRNRRPAPPLFTFRDVGRAEEFLHGELRPGGGGQRRTAVYPRLFASLGRWEKHPAQFRVMGSSSSSATGDACELAAVWGSVQMLTPLSFFPQSTSTFLGECD